MTAPYVNQSAPGWTRFRHGQFECTVVTDGLIQVGAPHPTFTVSNDSEIDSLLTDAFLPVDRMSIEQNILVVNTGERLILFDTGAGVNAQFGVKTFGTQVGRAIHNLRAAGIEPEQIDIVALTHAHPDHCWGLVDDDGHLLYPNAQVAVSAIDLDYWTDLSVLCKPEGLEMSEAMRDQFRGAHKNLTPYVEAGQVSRLSDGQVIAPGVTCHLRPGHSPGHMLYRIESEGQLLTVWGDICHHHVLLLAHPEWGIRFDYDQAAAARTRMQVFDEVIESRSTVLAYHFPFPGRGHLRRVNGRLDWVPIPLEFT